MIHGQAVQRPDTNRISGCVALRLFREHRETRNRTKDNRRKTFGIPQSVVTVDFSPLKTVLEDCRDIMEKIDLVLVTINNTTVLLINIL